MNNANPTPAEIVKAAEAAGCRFELEGASIAVFGHLPDALRQAIKEDREAFLRHLRGEPPEIVETVPPPSPAEAGATDATEDVFTATAPDLPQVRCNACKHGDDLGTGDPICGRLQCRVSGVFHWGNKLHPCARFEAR